MYKVNFTAMAKKDLKKLPAEVSERVIHALQKIRDDPFSNIHRLKISSDAPIYYMRVGDKRHILKAIFNYWRTINNKLMYT